jgi:5-(carboxyamino)imidazole ribonucleotide synthase
MMGPLQPDWTNGGQLNLILLLKIPLMNSPPAPGTPVIGILGGGQLGRMLAVSASQLGLSTHVFSPEPFPIAGQVASRTTQAEYSDSGALSAFADSVDVITYEFENIPSAFIHSLETQCEVLPPVNALSISQDRLSEKNFLSTLGLDVAPYANIETEHDLEAAVSRIGMPAMLKTRSFGYDGKGQVRLIHRNEAREAWRFLGDLPCVLERLIDFRCEVSVIAARSRNGQIVCFDPGENVHRDGILRTTTVPSPTISNDLCERLRNLAGTILSALHYVGVIGIETFIADKDEVLINEIAPRVHNSGHWTQDGCIVDQFEQHIRAIVGYPLGSGARHSDVVMTNLIGDEISTAEGLLSAPDVSLHLYGKADIRPGRKMGHFNRITGSANGEL